MDPFQIVTTKSTHQLYNRQGHSCLKSITGRGKDDIKKSKNQRFATLQRYSLNLERCETMDLIGLFAQKLGVLIL